MNPSFVMGEGEGETGTYASGEDDCPSANETMVRKVRIKRGNLLTFDINILLS